MTNISMDGEPIHLTPLQNYIVIDPLYLDDIIRGLKSLTNQIDFDKIKEIFFPYNDHPFTEFTAVHKIFKLSNILSVTEDYNLHDKKIFSTDSGALLFINKLVIARFIQNFSYDSLLSDELEAVDLAYWQDIINKFGQYNVGLIISPGVDSATDFIGSGTYMLSEE